MKRATKSDLGKACELYVRGDLLARGLKVTYPDNINGKNDVHAKIGSTWYTIQVESAQLTRNGRMRSRKVKRTVFSDLLALVHIPTQQIRYIANNAVYVPLELSADLIVLYGGGVSCQSSSISAPAAKGKSNSSLSTTKRRKTVPVVARSKKSNGVRPRKLALENLGKLED